MALSIKSDEADRLARELAAETGQSITTVVTAALQARLDELRRSRQGLARRLLAISADASRLPRRDDRTDDEIIGYDDDGLPGR
jgi:antitoxin VapB